jgi:WD40 repeat protein
LEIPGDAAFVFGSNGSWCRLGPAGLTHQGVLSHPVTDAVAAGPWVAVWPWVASAEGVAGSILDASDGRTVREFEADAGGGVMALVPIPDRGLAVLRTQAHAGGPGRIELVDARTGTLQWSLPPGDMIGRPAPVGDEGDIVLELPEGLTRLDRSARPSARRARRNRPTDFLPFGDGSEALAVGWDGHVELLRSADLATRVADRTPTAGLGLAASGGGPRRLLTLTSEGTALVTDFPGFWSAPNLPGPTKATWIPDHDAVFVVSGDGHAAVLGLPGWQPRWVQDLAWAGPVEHLAVDPGGTWAAVATSGGQYAVLATASGGTVTAGFRDGRITGLLFDGRGSLVILRGGAGLDVVDIEAGTIGSRAGGMASARVLPDGRLLRATPDRAWTVCHLRPLRCDVTPIPRADGDDAGVDRSRRPVDAAAGLTLIPGRGSIRLLDADGLEVRTWRGQPSGELSHGSGRVCATALAPGGRRAASGTLDGGVAFWDLDRGTVLAALPPRSNPVGAIHFVDEALAAVVWTDGLVVLVSVDTAAVRWEGHGAAAQSVELEADTSGRRVLVAGSDTWDLLDLTGLESLGPELLRRTNLRVCRADRRVVPVVPFPRAGTPWAPAEACDGPSRVP